jgi:micrococcal nuclease
MRIIGLLYFLFWIPSLFAQCGKVISVHDGDTFTMQLDGHQKLKVRVAFVDAPEHQQDFGEVSRKFTDGLIYGKQVCLEVKYKDPYGRTVAWVKLANGKVLNEELLKNGMAWHFKKYSKDIRLAQLEATAKTKRIGLWKTVNPEAPWEFRKERKIGFSHK